MYWTLSLAKGRPYEATTDGYCVCHAGRQSVGWHHGLSGSCGAPVLRRNTASVVALVGKTLGNIPLIPWTVTCASSGSLEGDQTSSGLG